MAIVTNIIGAYEIGLRLSRIPIIVFQLSPLFMAERSDQTETENN